MKDGGELQARQTGLIEGWLHDANQFIASRRIVFAAALLKMP
jgi:hypothetical protein